MGVFAEPEKNFSLQTQSGRSLYSPGIVQSGLVLNFDASKFYSYPLSGTTWTDLSGNAGIGTLTNGLTFNSGNGGYINYDGTNQYVTTTFSFSPRPFSINGWFYFSMPLAGWQNFVSQDTSQSTPFSALSFGKVTNDVTQATNAGRTANTVGLALLNASNNTNIFCDDTTAVSYDVWYNYCVSVSTTNIILYRNGSSVTTTTNNNNMATPTGSVIIGAGYYDNGIFDHVRGRISQVSIYNRELTAAEVLQNYNATKSRFGL